MANTAATATTPVATLVRGWPDAHRIPVYPITRPAAGDDARFSVGLALDVAAVVHRHRHPPLTTGADLVRLQLTLSNLINQEKKQ